MKYMGSFGDWLKGRRKALDLTQTELAAQVGCSVATIRKIEGDGARPSKQIAVRLADVLAVADEERVEFIAFARRVKDSLRSWPVQNGSRDASHHLPSQPTSFIGRTEELAQIAERLDNPDCRLLTLVGPGGIGKTRLALEAARVANFADGVYFVSLTPIASPAAIATTIGDALGFAFYRPDDPQKQLVDYLAGKHALLVLDNFEHLLAGIPSLLEMLVNAPRVKLLVTSRERLNLQEEWVLPLEGLSFPGESDCERIEQYSAVQLFAQRAQQVQPRFSLADNTGSVVLICQAVEGMPLGVELAASWLRVMPCDQIAVHIRHSLDFLATPLRNVAERHRSMRAVLDHSWKLLSEAEQSALAGLSVFRGGFDLEAAEAVAGASLPVLGALCDKSLIWLTPTGRYNLHELLRQFASDKLHNANEEAAAICRHLEYFVGLAEHAESALYSPQQVTCHDQLEDNHDNLRAALARALDNGQTAVGLRLAAALEWFWHMRQYQREGREWLEKLLAAAKDAPPSLRAKALQRAGDLSLILEEAGRSVELNEQALALARDIGDSWNIAWSLSNLGFASGFLGPDRAQQAIALCEQALALFLEIGDKWGINHTRARIGYGALATAQYERAADEFDECLRQARGANVKSAMAWALAGLAEARFCQGNFGRAFTLCQEAAGLFREIRLREGLGPVLILTGRAAHMLGNLQQAWRSFEETLVFAHETGSSSFAALALRHLGSLMRSQGNNVDAHKLITESLVLEQDLGRMAGVAHCLAELGGLASDNRTPERAVRLLSAARAQFDANSMDIDMYLYTQAEIDCDVSATRQQLGEAAFEAAWAEGQAMTPEQAIAYALSENQEAGRQG